MMKKHINIPARAGVGFVTAAIAGLGAEMIWDLNVYWFIPITISLLIGTRLIETKETEEWKQKHFLN